MEVSGYSFPFVRGNPCLQNNNMLKAGSLEDCREENFQSRIVVNLEFNPLGRMG